MFPRARLALAILVVLSGASASEDSPILQSVEGTSTIDPSLGFLTDTFNATVLTKPFFGGVWKSFSLIAATEILDKTWFLALVMAMRNTKLPVYAGAMVALTLMTFISVFLSLFTQLIPTWITFWAATGLMFFFGFKMFWEAYHMKKEQADEEYEKVERTVDERARSEMDRLLEDAESRASVGSSGGAPAPPPPPSAARRFFKVFGETFVLTFLAEWGDRSQISTVIMAAEENIIGVFAGGVLGHAFCTGLAVLGGNLVRRCASLRIVTLVSGVVFTICGIIFVIQGVNR